MGNCDEMRAVLSERYIAEYTVFSLLDFFEIGFQKRFFGKGIRLESTSRFGFNDNSCFICYLRKTPN